MKSPKELTTVRFNLPNAPLFLESAGYQKSSKGFIRQIDDKYRYHAYCLDGGKVEIHSDKVLKFGAKSFHSSIIYDDLFVEIDRILKLQKEPDISECDKISLAKMFVIKKLMLESFRFRLPKKLKEFIIKILFL